MADTAVETETKKFEYRSISSSFVAPEEVKTDAAPAPESESATAATSTTTTTETAATTTEQPTDKDAETKQKAQAKLEDLKRAIARAKRFGSDATELEKLLKRADKFGPEVLLANNSLAGVDKPLVERSGGRKSVGGATTKPYEKKVKPELSEEEKEKLRKRAERFGQK